MALKYLYVLARRDILQPSKHHKCFDKVPCDDIHCASSVQEFAVRTKTFLTSGTQGLFFYFYFAFSLFLSHSPCCLLYNVSFFIDLYVSTFIFSSGSIFVFELFTK